MTPSTRCTTLIGRILGHKFTIRVRAAGVTQVTPYCTRCGWTPGQD